ncbi:MAG: chorismate synthase [Chloroflexi bacterium]|nr:chorismate synthase [Chloroflexota bacterium]
MTIRFLTAGESHGEALVVILEGLPAGLQINESTLHKELQRRQTGFGSGGRMKIEHDRARILSGVLAGVTTGAPIALWIENKDHSKWKAKAVNAFTTPRPGHGDLTGTVKYGYNDLRPALERASARETAARVAMGAICKALLAEFDIRVGGYVSAIGAISANLDHLDIEKRAALAEENDLRCPDPQAAESMRNRIREIMNAGDTLGGIIEIVALGLPVGLGSFAQWDLRLDARLGAALLSIPAVKGVEIGPAFENSRLPGTQVHDAIHLKEGEIVRETNRAGGLEGGITNGQPLLMRAAMKPIATTLAAQKTIDLFTQKETETVYERSDFCPVPRAVPIAEAMVAFVLTNALLEKLGGDSLDEMKPRFAALRNASLKDLNMTGGQILFWPDQEGI